jgi:type IV pilus assembly protein PilW
MRAPRPSRGFTLIELMTTVAISSVAIMAIAFALITQTQQYHAQSNRRVAQSNARQALTFLQDQLHMAGYGVDPDRAIIAFDSFDAANPAAAALNFPDAITLHARDPLFQRTVTGANNARINFSQALTQPIPQGQILLLLCGGASAHLYVTASQTAAVGDTSVNLAAAAAGAESPLTSPGPRFHQQDQIASDPCFTDFTQPPTLVKVDRAAFYVARFDDDANAGTPSVPYLMMHRGTDLNGDGAVNAQDASPISDGVEQLQIAYVLNTTSNAPPLVAGVNDAVPWGDSWDANSPPPRPRMRDSYRAASRLTHHPANIRQVRVTLVARGPNTGVAQGDDFHDPDLASSTGTEVTGLGVPWRQMENLGEDPAQLSPSGGGYERMLLRVSVAPKNLLMRGQFLPPNGTFGG